MSEQTLPMAQRSPAASVADLDCLVRDVCSCYRTGIADAFTEGLSALPDYCPGTVRLDGSTTAGRHYLAKLRAQVEKYINACVSTTDDRLLLESAFDLFFRSEAFDSLDDITSFAAAFDLARLVSRTDDPYSKEKAVQEKFWHSIAATLAGHLDGTTMSALLPSILRLATLANFDDVGNSNLSCCKHDLEELIACSSPSTWLSAVRQHEACCDLPEFLDAVSAPGPILYILDNAGEVLLDLAAVQSLLESGFVVYMIARQRPVFNDVTIEDLKRLLSASGSLTDAVVRSRLVPLAVARGTLDLRMLGPRALDAWRRAAAGSGGIIAKGSANTKALWRKKLTLPSLLCFNLAKSQFLQSELAKRRCVASHPLTYALVYQQPGA